MTWVKPGRSVIERLFFLPGRRLPYLLGRRAPTSGPLPFHSSETGPP